MAMEILWKVRIMICAGMTVIMVACSYAPTALGATQTAGISTMTVGTILIGQTSTPENTAVPSITLTPTITSTPTPPPDVEISQLQIANDQGFFGEIINHLTVPVIFEDQKSPFHFDLFDPILNQHFLGDDYKIDRIENASIIPCVVYPGEPAFFFGGDVYHQWFEQVVDPTIKDQLQITYYSYGKPWPDWKENNSHDKVWDITWNIDSKVLYFSFKHTPLIGIHGNEYYYYGSMGLFDKENHLLGVGIGGLNQTIGTGIDDNYWITLDYHTPGYQLERGWDWYGLGMEAIKSRLDHIEIMLEILQGIDGICRNYVPTATPGSG